MNGRQPPGPPPLPPAAYERRPSHAEHAITPETRVSAPAHVTWKAAIVLVGATAAAVAWGVRQMIRLDASETNASRALAEIVEIRKAIESLRPDAIEREAFSRLVGQVKARRLIADCPTQTVRGLSTKPCAIVGLAEPE